MIGNLKIIFRTFAILAVLGIWLCDTSDGGHKNGTGERECADGAEYFESFDSLGEPEGPAGSYWYFTGDIYPGQKAWDDFIPGDGTAYLTVDADVTNDLDSTAAYQMIVFGPVGPGRRISTRVRGLVVPGLTGFLFTYQEEASFDEIDIEVVSVDTGVWPSGHETYPDGWTDARFNAWANSSTTTFLPEVSFKQPVVNADGESVSLEDGEFHTYTIAWYPDSVEYYIDGILQAENHTLVPDSESEVLIGFRDLPWAGDFTWDGRRTARVDWLCIEKL